MNKGTTRKNAKMIYGNELKREIINCSRKEHILRNHSDYDDKYFSMETYSDKYYTTELKYMPLAEQSAKDVMIKIINKQFRAIIDRRSVGYYCIYYITKLAFSYYVDTRHGGKGAAPEYIAKYASRADNAADDMVINTEKNCVTSMPVLGETHIQNSVSAK